MSQVANTTVETTTVKPTVELGKFGGKYGNASMEIYTFLSGQYKLSPSKSHRIAHMFACDHGAAIAKAAESGKSERTFKTGKVSKEGMVTLREAVATTAKNVANTYPLAIGHAIQWLGEAGKHGISYGKTDWQFTPEIIKWIEEMPE